MKNNFRFVFNDRAFDDGWAEPYIVEVITNCQIEGNALRNKISKKIKEIENSEDGIECADSGITQVLDAIPEIKCYNIHQDDFSFEYGRN